MYYQIKKIYQAILMEARTRNALVSYIYMNIEYDTGNFIATCMIGNQAFRVGFDCNNEFYMKETKGEDKDACKQNKTKKI